MQNRTPGPPSRGQPLPDFIPVQRQYRHDGWTHERQRAFIAALADTGSVKRAAALVNMAAEGAYMLRRQAGAESFRRAWEAALDFGVQRLKDLAFERAIEGELVPVMSFGKLIGYRRKTNDRLLMFCLRMNARAPDGRRHGATQFLPRSGEVAAPADGGGSAPRTPTLSTPLAPTEQERTDDQVHLIRHFDPVDLSLPQIEALQALLAEAAETRRKLQDDPAADPSVPYISAADTNPPFELAWPDETGGYYQPEAEIPWTNLDPEGLRHQAEIDKVVAEMREELRLSSPLPKGEGDSRPSASGVRAGPSKTKSRRKSPTHQPSRSSRA